MKIETKVCEWCGEEFRKRSRDSKKQWAKRKACSQSCGAKIRTRKTSKARLLQKISITNSGCWEMMSSVQGNGYSKIWDGEKVVYAHRLSYEIFRGPIKDGMVIDHLCRNRKCVNPYHLEVVTMKVNTQRGDAGEHMAKIQAAKTHCPKGHPYSGDNLILRDGRRYCRECIRQRRRLRTLRDKQKRQDKQECLISLQA